MTTRQSSFVSGGARIQFWTMCAATFLAFITSSTLYYLPVLLVKLGVSDATAGAITASSAIPITLAILLSGKLITYFDALRLALLGQLMTLFSYIALNWYILEPGPAAVARVFGGLGFGLFWPAAMSYVKNRLSTGGLIYLVGIFAVMISAPTSIGPALAEWYFKSFGLSYLFIVLSFPLIIGIILMSCLLVYERGRPHMLNNATVGRSYLSLFSNRLALVPNTGLLFVGFIWGFGMSFVGVIADRHGLLVGQFLTSCALATLVSRFTLTWYFSRKDKELTLVFGFALVTLCCGILSFSVIDQGLLVVAGITFGAGNSILFPTLSVWSSEAYLPGDKVKAEAVIGVLSHLGLFGAPFVVGTLAMITGLDAWPMICGALTLILAAFFMMVWLAGRRR